MRVSCINNIVTAISESEARERVRHSMHLDGPLTDLAVGREYAVQAIEERDGGLWLYLHTVAVNDYPFPYPIELFAFRDKSLPASWEIHLQLKQGNVAIKRIAFAAWASDDLFYERLVEGDTGAVLLYRRYMVRPLI